MQQNDHEDWLAIIDDGLKRNPDILALLFDRSVTLEALGRIAEAEQTCRQILAKDPRHSWGRTRLAQLLVRQQRYSEAIEQYQLILEHDPDDALVHVLIAGLYGLSQDFVTAKLHYLRALELAPDSPHAHHGLALILAELGEPETIAYHQAHSTGTTCYYTMQFRGTGDPIPLLLLVAASENSGSMTFERLIDNTIFQTTKLVLESFDQQSPLPTSALIVNGISDVERAEPALRIAQTLLQNTTLPVINDVQALLNTGRAENALRLRQIPNVRTPHTAAFHHLELRVSDRIQTLENQGFHFPFLIRAPGFFAGRQFHKVSTLDELDHALEIMNSDTCIVIEYIDTRDNEGFFRKFRTLFIDGKLYPLHLAISDHWKVHYFSALMYGNAEFRAIEADFLLDHEAFVGPTVITALHAIERMLGLDYAGVDFGFDRQGNLVIYEANAGMSLALPGDDPLWAYRKPAAEAVIQAVQAMLHTKIPAPR